MHTTDLIRRAVNADNKVVRQILMTSKAVVLKNSRIRLLDHYRLVEVLQREALGVMPAVVRFGDVLADKVVRKMTIDTNGYCMVARFLPRVVLRLHDMAINADLGIIAHIGQAFRVQEGIRADPQKDADRDGQNANGHGHTQSGTLPFTSV